MRWFVCFIVAVIILIMVPFDGNVRAADGNPGTISGELVNKTAGGTSVANQKVELAVLRDGSPVELPAPVMTDNNGKFVFSGLQVGAALTYRLMTNFQGAAYFSEPIVLSDINPSKSAALVVYDAITSDDAISIEMAHLIVYYKERELLVQEFYLFSNKGDRTYTGAAGTSGHPGTLRITVPADAREISGPGLKDVSTEGKETVLLDVLPVLPGRREVLLSYRLPFESGRYLLTRTLFYPAASFRLLVEADNLQISARNLVPQETLDIQGKKFAYLLGKDLPKGARFDMDFVAATASNVPWLWIAVVAAIAAIIILLVVRRRVKQPVDEERLLREVASLDDDYEAGLISEDDYHRQRSQKKAELRSLMKKDAGRDD